MVGMGVLELNLSLATNGGAAESRKFSTHKAAFPVLSCCRIQSLDLFAISADCTDSGKRRKVGNAIHGVTRACFSSRDYDKQSPWLSTPLSPNKLLAVQFSWRLCCYDQQAASQSDTHRNSNEEQLGETEGLKTTIHEETRELEREYNSWKLSSQYSGSLNRVTKESNPEGNGTRDVHPVGRWRVEEGCTTKEGVGDQKNIGYGVSNAGYANSSGEPIFMGVKEPVYEVLELHLKGCVTKKEISRRQLLKESGLRLRDIRSVDPSLWITNSIPALLVRDHAILLNMGSLKAIVTRENVLIFDHKSIGAQNFLQILRQRSTPENNGNLAMPFELEIVEAALIAKTQRLEQTLMQIEPQVVSLLERILPNRLTANVLEELRISKQALVELSSKAGSLRQMLLELLEHPHEIRRMTIIGRSCHFRKEDGMTECVTHSDKQAAEDEEEEIEMILENYLQRCESCHGQAQKLLDSAKEMEDSISVNLSARRLEVSRLELLLQVGTFCAALGALIAGIFGMNLRSYLEEHVLAFWLTTAGIILGGFALFFLMYTYLKRRRIL